MYPAPGDASHRVADMMPSCRALSRRLALRTTESAALPPASAEGQSSGPPRPTQEASTDFGGVRSAKISLDGRDCLQPAHYVPDETLICA